MSHSGETQNFSHYLSNHEKPVHSSSRKPQSKAATGTSASASCINRTASNGSSSSSRSAISSEDKSSSADLPRSICNAPPEMWAAIRRKQNSESSRRSRARRRQADKDLKAQVMNGERRIKELEKRVSDLELLLRTKKNSKRMKSPGSRRPENSGARKLCTAPGEFFELNEPFFGDAF